MASRGELPTMTAETLTLHHLSTVELKQARARQAVPPLSVCFRAPRAVAARAAARPPRAARAPRRGARAAPRRARRSAAAPRCGAHSRAARRTPQG
jgi:hypothetical protein